MGRVDLGAGSPRYWFHPNRLFVFYFLEVLRDLEKAISLFQISVSFSKKCGKWLENLEGYFEF